MGTPHGVPTAQGSGEQFGVLPLPCTAFCELSNVSLVMAFFLIAVH